jgi:catechol 2,3-dioxygenase-like lactoylglutathione lyase family enzyme
VSTGAGFHLALAAPGLAELARFHQQALAHGGQDNGAPGLRAHYGAGYHAAFVIDPDGHRLEAVFKAPPDEPRASA